MTGELRSSDKAANAQPENIFKTVFRKSHLTYPDNQDGG
jgi:hypothetical protein